MTHLGLFVPHTPCSIIARHVLGVPIPTPRINGQDDRHDGLRRYMNGFPVGEKKNGKCPPKGPKRGDTAWAPACKFVSWARVGQGGQKFEQHVGELLLGDPLDMIYAGMSSTRL